MAAIATLHDRVWRKATRACAVAIGITALALTLGVATASASGESDIAVNGCGSASGISRYIVPDNPLGFPFGPSCNQHDRCYADGLVTKGSCDNQFYVNLRDVCDGNLVCDGLAWVYYQGVNLGGQSAWTVAAQQRLDALINKLLACQGDSSCEQAVSQQFGDESAKPDPPAGAPSDPGTSDPGTGDSGGDYGAGDSGGDYSGGGDSGGGGGSNDGQFAVSAEQ
ncbi:MAG: phospholipase [Actinomycetota bacterium]|nr:phospholipase [Actinomycetota bacterium]